MSLVAHSLEEAGRAIAARSAVWCIGVFDGVHRGHQALIREAVAEADRLGCPSVIFTFRNHPLSLLAPAYAPLLLTDLDERVRRLEALEASLIAVVEFARELADLEPDAFVREILHHQLHVASLWCGSDFRFGRDGRGDLPLLEELGSRCGIAVRTIQPVQLHGHIVSSTWIRSLLEEGNVEHAAECMGCRHVVRGTVGRGDGRGTQLQFPTANLRPPSEIVLPADGIYAARVEARGRIFGGMVNLGPSPTFGVTDRRLEVHLLDFEGDLVGDVLAVHFVARLRDIQRFDSAEKLVAQIRADERRTRRILQEAAE